MIFKNSKSCSIQTSFFVDEASKRFGFLQVDIFFFYDDFRVREDHDGIELGQEVPESYFEDFHFFSILLLVLNDVPSVVEANISLLLWKLLFDKPSKTWNGSREFEFLDDSRGQLRHFGVLKDELEELLEYIWYEIPVFVLFPPTEILIVLFFIPPLLRPFGRWGSLFCLFRLFLVL